jgi:CRISPR/Cas system CSM-associated protein Csm4 (group 5 of RAMP superfamily)
MYFYKKLIKTMKLFKLKTLIPKRTWGCVLFEKNMKIITLGSYHVLECQQEPYPEVLMCFKMLS